MPIYEYWCGSCGESFEALKRLSEEKDREECPRCGTAGERIRTSLFRAPQSPPATGKGACSPGGGGRGGFRFG